MVSRHTVVYLLFFAVVGSLAVLRPTDSRSAPADDGDIPPAALSALRDGRYLRASLILRQYLAATADSTPDAVLLAARAEAGWGEWERVRQLLEGRTWLDGAGSGYGWNLLGRSQLALGRYQQGSASLARYLTLADTAGVQREQGIAELRRAEALAGEKKYAEALVAYDRAATMLPHVGDWIGVFAAGVAADAGDTTQVRTRLARVDTVLSGEWSWRVPVRAYQNAGNVPAAIGAAEAAIARLTSDTRRAAAWTMLGTLRDGRGDIVGAKAAYLRALGVSQGSAGGLEAARRLSEMPGLSPADRLLIGRVYLRHGNTTRGVAGLRAYIDAGAGTQAERDRLLYELANAHFRAGENKDAEKALLSVAGTVQDRATVADALYTAARAQYRDGRIPAARTTLDRIIRDYADQPAAVRAAYLSGDLEHDDVNLDRAADYYRQAIRFDPTSDEAAIARMRLGGIAMAAGRFDDALREFEEYRNTHRSGRTYQQATYWSARAFDSLGQPDSARSRLVEARRLDPFSYYGGLAERDLEQEIWRQRLEPAPAHNNRFDSDVAAALARVDLLREIGWNEAAAFEMERVRQHFAAFDGASYALAEAQNERGFTTAGISLGWEIYRREGAWNLRLLRIVYPFPFRNIIVAEARERNVDPFLAAALIRQESMFNPRARSGVGALGLMQVMPATGRSLARNLGVSGFKPEMLTQPELNVHFGMAYLADQLRSYGNRIDAVLAAYNAGPGRVSRWQKFPEYRDTVLFAERIPYDETRDYVRIVQNNRRLYQALYADQPAD